MTNEVLDGSLIEAVRLIRTGRISPSELTAAAIERIEADETGRRYFNRFEPDEALTDAKKSKT